jgi:hypothetical protein
MEGMFDDIKEDAALLPLLSVRTCTHMYAHVDLYILFASVF